MRGFFRLLVAVALFNTVCALSGTYEGQVPLILDMKVTFNSDGTMDFDNNVKIAHQEIKCEKVAIKVSGTEVTFPNIQKSGDCMGDALRKQHKDVTKFYIAINPDGTLTFHSTWPALKLKKKVTIASPLAGTYEGKVPLILDMKVIFNSDGTMDFDNNVKIAHQEIKCEKVAIKVSDTEVTFPNIQKTGDCMGDALRKQHKDVTKFYIAINSDGTLTFHSTWPALKLQKKLTIKSPLSGSYEGQVPLILDMKVTFNPDGTMDFDNNVKIAHQEIKCEKVAIKVSDTEVTFPNIQKTGDCMGDALRKQHKDVTKFYIAINSDGTLTFHSTWPALKLKKKVTIESPFSGMYEGQVPFILDMKVTFNSDGTMDFDNNVKIAHQEIKCEKVAIKVTDTAVTFPNILKTGDCMGDALRKEKKDVTKFWIAINSDGTLTFHSTWPDLKLKKKSALQTIVIV